MEQQDPGRGPQPKLGAWELVTSLVYHVTNGAGILSQHVYQLLGVDIKDGSLSQRRQRIGFELRKSLASFRLLFMATVARVAERALAEEFLPTPADMQELEKEHELVFAGDGGLVVPLGVKAASGGVHRRPAGRCLRSGFALTQVG